MKKLYLAGLFLLAFKLYGGGFKIGYVDLQKVFQNYKKVKESEEIFRKEVMKEQKRIDNLKKKIDDMQDEFKKKKDILSPEKRREKEMEIMNKIKELSEIIREVNQKLDRRMKELRKARLDEILSVIKEFGKKNKYNIIIDSNAVIYADKGIDITDQIIKILNEKKK